MHRPDGPGGDYLSRNLLALFNALVNIIAQREHSPRVPATKRIPPREGHTDGLASLRRARLVGGAAGALVQGSGTYDLDACIAALSDSTRRAIVHMLLYKPLRAGELARSVEMSPQALSRHLRVLRKVGLVVEQGLERDARVRIYSARLGALEPLQEWLWAIEGLWRQQLESFNNHAESIHRTRRSRS
jgi:DNA-binding transcriptional ArsR family regulator